LPSIQAAVRSDPTLNVSQFVFESEKQPAAFFIKKQLVILIWELLNGSPMLPKAEIYCPLLER
jgi:hypothetical protein